MTTGRGKSLNVAPLWIVTLLGIAVTALGVYIQVTGTNSIQSMVAGTLAAIGGGIIGAVISIYFSAGEGRDTLLAIRDILAGSLRSKMRSTEQDLRPLRRQ